MEIKGPRFNWPERENRRVEVGALKRPQERQMMTLTSVRSFCGRSPSADGA